MNDGWIAATRGGVVLATVALLLACSNGKSQETRKPPEAATTPTAAVAKDAGVTRKLVREAPLGKHARRILRRRMLRHGDDMENLQWAALMLDYQSTATIAKWISEEPRIARPVAGDESAFNQVFPPAFFALQDEMHAAAGSLSKAAAARDDDAVATSYSRLTGTCVRCHALYLKMPATNAK